MKRIVCCLDGTWNSSRSPREMTNVRKIARLVCPSDDRGIRQTALYVSGIASEEGLDHSYLRGAVGLGVEDRIRTAYESIAREYEPGDEIYLFGFSRGAFEARSLANLIELIGLARDLETFRYEAAFELYRLPRDRRDAIDIELFRSGTHNPVPITCIGLWDTIGNLGNPFFSDSIVTPHFEFHDLSLGSTVRLALHALSIDEVRGPFRPSFWTLAEGAELGRGQHVEQVWFAGNHGDIGGGYAEAQLSDIPLHWMVERVADLTGLALDHDQLAHMSSPDPLGPQHSEARGWLFMWSAVLPYVRLLLQRPNGLSKRRRRYLGYFRSSRVRDGETVLNEALHDSVGQRFGQRVEVRRGDRPRAELYRPRNVAAVIDPATLDGAE